ncbi:MAG: peptidoglycan bridge formation glycyltransferase FemA/FemB family protein [Ilumatobacteraceae bacterium]
MNQQSGWKVWPGTADEWDRELLRFDDANIYQSGNWGTHRSKFGWSVSQFVYTSDGTVRSMAQILYKKISPLAMLCWIPGGPVGDLEFFDTDLISLIKKKHIAPLLSIRLSAMTQYSDGVASLLRSRGWQKPSGMLNSDKTLVYDIDPNITERRVKLSKNWSRNLSRGEQRGLSVSEWANPTTAQITSLTDEMSRYKRLRHNRQKIAQVTDSLLTTFGSDILMVKCTNSQGELLALRGAIRLGHKAFDMFAATSPAGRKEYASNLCFWKLIELCERDGITHYDLSGVDPERNEGVYNFKKGIGATDFTYLGEWSYSRPRIVGAIVSRIISRRMRPE